MQVKVLLPLLITSLFASAIDPPSGISAETVRDELRRPLSTEEQMVYRGITMTAMNGTMFEELFDINTPEELIAADYYGRLAAPSDDASNI